MSGTPQETVVVTNDFHAQRTEPGIPRIFTSQQKDNSRLRKEGTTMSANLVIVHSNPQPNRKRHYPEQWLVYSQGRELQGARGARQGLHTSRARQGRGMKFDLRFAVHAGAFAHRQDLPCPLQLGFW
jgi:hypothetical protein